jgi:hypothetical protein
VKRAFYGRLYLIIAKFGGKVESLTSLPLFLFSPPGEGNRKPAPIPFREAKRYWSWLPVHCLLSLWEKE